jgi:outer membrane protein OmpA-like peptidoglycan-associated protein
MVRRLALALLLAASATACASKTPAAGGGGTKPPPPELAAVYYEPGSKKLDFADRPAVTQAAAELERNPELHVLLIGRTDSTGDANGNMQLGLQRAHEFRVALLNKGAGKIDHARVHIGSRGQAEPIASNEKEDGRKLNRRVEFYFYYPDGTPLKSRFAPPVIIEGE